MIYTPIIALLDYCNISYTDIENLNIPKIKKQITAEFGFSDSGILEIDGSTYNKNEVLNVIDANNFIAVLGYQIAIKHQPKFQEFLITGNIPKDIYKIINYYTTDHLFISYISPYIAPLFNREMKSRLQKHNFDGAKDWLTLTSLITEEDLEVAFESTRAFLTDSIKLFKNLNKDSFVLRMDEVKPWRYGWASLLNELPNFLLTQKEELAFKLFDFTLKIYKTNTLWAFRISSELIYLNYVTYSLSESINHNYKFFSHYLNKKHDQYSTRIILIALFAIPIIYLLGTSSINFSFFSSSNSSYKYPEGQKDNSEKKPNENHMKMVFEHARILSPKKNLHKYKTPFFNLYTHTISYFSFQNDSLTPKSTFTVLLKNSSTYNLDVYFQSKYKPNDIEFMKYGIRPNDSLYIHRGNAENIDFLLTIDNRSMAKLNLKDVTKNIYYFAPAKAKLLKQTFGDTSLNIIAPNDKKHYTLKFENNEEKIQIQSSNLNLVKMSNP